MTSRAMKSMRAATRVNVSPGMIGARGSRGGSRKDEQEKPFNEPRSKSDKFWYGDPDNPDRPTPYQHSPLVA